MSSSRLLLLSLVLAGLGLDVSNLIPETCFSDHIPNDPTTGFNWRWVELLVISLFFSDKANRLDVGNAVNPRPSEDDNKLVVQKSPNAVNPLVWDYHVSFFPRIHSLAFSPLFLPLNSQCSCLCS